MHNAELSLQKVNSPKNPRVYLCKTISNIITLKVQDFIWRSFSSDDSSTGPKLKVSFVR